MSISSSSPNDDLIRKFSLRGHQAPITCIHPISYPQWGPTTVLTGDSNGLLIWWDITKTKRPLGIWQGHSNGSPIVTILQIDNGSVLTHSKDSSVKIWQPLHQFNSQFIADLTKISEQDLIFPSPSFIEIPVNSLNFCNVDVVGNYLFCCNTMDSNNFDVYALYNNDEFNLRRLLNNIDPYRLFTKSQGIDFEINQTTTGDRGKYGSMMRVRFVNQSLVYIGYESGHVLGVKLNLNPNSVVTSSRHNDQTIINKDPVAELVYENDFHVPQPVLSLEYNQINQTIISGSAGKSVVIHPINIPGKPTKINTHHYGASSITTNSLGNIAIQFWDRVVKGYDESLTNQLFRYQRPFERIDKVDSFAAEPHSNEKSQQSRSKSSVIKLVDLSSTTGTEHEPSSFKQLVRQRKLIGSGSLLFVGYNDGLIDVFKLKDPPVSNYKTSI